MGEALGKSQKTAKELELETEFLIINKRPEQALHIEALGCLQPAWGTQEATRLLPTGFSGYRPNGPWDRVLGTIFKSQRGGKVNILG